MNSYELITYNEVKDKKTMTVFVEKIPGQKYYYLQFSTTSSNFDKEKINFYLVVNSFKVH